MPQALPPALAALLARDDFADAVFEGGRCAHSVGEAPGTIFELALDRLLAALDGESTVSPSGAIASTQELVPVARPSRSHVPSHSKEPLAAVPGPPQQG